MNENYSFSRFVSGCLWSRAGRDSTQNTRKTKSLWKIIDLELCEWNFMMFVNGVVCGRGVNIWFLFASFPITRWEKNSRKREHGLIQLPNERSGFNLRRRTGSKSEQEERQELTFFLPICHFHREKSLKRALNLAQNEAKSSLIKSIN